MLVSIAEMVMVVDEDLIQTQTAECLTIYSTCENKLLYMYYTTTILCSPFNTMLAQLGRIPCQPQGHVCLH